MIFTIGMSFALLGLALMSFYGTGYKYTKNAYDFAGLGMIGVGGLGVLLSLSTLAWKYLP